MRQDLSPQELKTLEHIWDNDISIGGAPEGWDYDYFVRKVEDKLYNGFSFKTSVMKVLSEVPRPEEEKAKTPKEITVEKLQNDLRAQWKKMKLAQAIEWAKRNPAPPPVVDDWR